MSEYPYLKIFLRSLKIAVGSSLAIFVAQLLELQNAASAGIIKIGRAHV